MVAGGADFEGSNMHSVMERQMRKVVPGLVGVGARAGRWVARRQRERDSRAMAVRLQRSMMESGRGADISPSERKAIQRHSLKKFGSARFAEWLITYAMHRDEFHVGWVPSEYFRWHMLHAINPPEVTTLSNIKTLSSTLLGHENVPDVAFFVGGSWFDRDRKPCDYKRILSVFEEYDHVYVKADYLDQGRGVFRLDEAGFRSFFSSPLQRDYVVQYPVSQHADIEVICPSAVSTLRLLTLKVSCGAPRVIGAQMKFGQGNANYLSVEGNQLKSAVDLHSGCLGAAAYDQNWRQHYVHPDTGVTFSGLSVPAFSEAKILCLELHSKVPHFGYIGWDIVVDAGSKLHLLEWNSVFPAFAFLEAHQGPMVSDMVI